MGTYPSSQTSYNFTVPTSWQGGSDFKVMVRAFDGSVSDSSDNFFTITTANQPSITVLAPNGGEVWHNSETKQIKWSSANLGTLNINLDVLNSSGIIVYNITGNVPNTGLYYWTIPADFKSGSYKILVSSADKGPSAQDYSHLKY